MNKFIEFFKKPRNIYFSIIVMLTVFTTLMSVSFSYYVEDSTNNTKMVSLNKIDNRIESKDLVDNVVYLEPLEEKEINLDVVSYNDFESSYNLYYKTTNNVSIRSLDEIKDTINTLDSHHYRIIIKNNEENQAKVEINIANGYLGNELTYDGVKIEKS